MKYAEILAEMAYVANLSWGNKTGLVVDARSWEELKENEQKVYIDRLDRIARMINFPCLDNSGLAQAKLTASYLHEMWLQTAKDDHAARKPWSALTPDEQFKGEIYLGFIKLYQIILKDLEQHE